MGLFRIGRRRKKLVGTLSDGLGVYRNTITVHLDTELEQGVRPGQKHTLVIPGEVINDSKTPRSIEES